ncbi:hypothetical protein [Nocardia sp. NPDC002869]|uniref:hypothetical protein n=1 Tax=Nocardia sp. NPDC002869 TaxID=3161032 RepID=UPI00398D1D09
MWGPPQDRPWADNDPFLHPEALRGTALYLSAGTGAAGPLDGPGIHRDPGKLADQLLLAAVVACTAASVWCGTADSANELVAARVAQGVAGAGMAAQTIAILTSAAISTMPKSGPSVSAGRRALIEQVGE